MYLVFDTETTGLPKKWNAPLSDLDNWPRCVQLAWQLHDSKGILISSHSYLIKPENYNIPYESEKIHGISTALATNIGDDLVTVLNKFTHDLSLAGFIIGHNVKFDLNIIGAELLRIKSDVNLLEKDILDTCTELTANVCKIPGGRGGKFKFPTLIELYSFLFNDSFSEAHNASADVEATARAFFELVRIGIINQSVFKGYPELSEGLRTFDESKVPLFGIKHLNLKKESEKFSKKASKENPVDKKIIDSIPRKINIISFFSST